MWNYKPTLQFCTQIKELFVTHVISIGNCMGASIIKDK